jgi:hypothetical protein
MRFGTLCEMYCRPIETVGILGTPEMISIRLGSSERLGQADSLR